jgi:hypothetical protein
MAFPLSLRDMTHTAEAVLAALGPQSFSDKATSFSPWYSDCGLGCSPQTSGITYCFLHHNRATHTIGSASQPFLRLNDQADTAAGTLAGVSCGSTTIIGTARNTFLVAQKSPAEASFAPLQGYDQWRWQRAGDCICWQTFVPSGDARDPDRFWPVLIAARVIDGTSTLEADGRLTLAGAWRLALHIQVLETSPDAAAHQLTTAADTVAAARQASLEWLQEALGTWQLPQAVEAPRQKLLAKAAITLLSNACIGTGLLAGRIAAYPNRGFYPTHFLWDACFQNLALEHFHPRLADDSLCLLTENLRVDGMMAHFLCATWMRPHDSQPPLVGWAAERLAHRDPTVARRLLHPIVKNNRWWLRQRMTRWGLIANEDPMETGWDDTPRFDDGPILPLDMNAYLIKQLQVTYDFALSLGENALAKEALAAREALNAALMQHCFNEDTGRFHDVLAADGRQLPIKTPAIFLPLWAGVLPIDDPRSQQLIDTYLLNPDYFYGAIPFPSVAYDEPTYTPAYSSDSPDTGVVARTDVDAGCLAHARITCARGEKTGAPTRHAHLPCASDA